jgi:hypothetical protein
MSLTAADLLRLALTALLLLLAYARLSALLRFLFPGRVRQRLLPEAPEPVGPIAEGLRQRGFRYLGGRQEDIFRLHGRRAAVYVHPDGRVVDLPHSGQLVGTYIMTLYEDGRGVLTRSGAGREILADRYRSRVLGGSKGLRDLLEAHAESEGAVSLGQTPRRVETLEERRALGRTWYIEHARTELAVPAALDGALLLGFLAFGIYLWLL